MGGQQALQIQDLLIEWAKELTPQMKAEGWQRLSVQMLWHSCFIVLFCDVQELESLTPEYEEPASGAQFQNVGAWVSTEQATRCAAHAFMIMRLMEQIRASEAPALHVARAAFHAGLVLAVISCPEEGDGIPEDEGSRNLDLAFATSRYPELRSAYELQLFSNSDWGLIESLASRAKYRTYAFGICAILRFLGPWHNASIYSKRLGRMLEMIESRYSGIPG